jgi:hypothetical protein
LVSTPDADQGARGAEFTMERLRQRSTTRELYAMTATDVLRERIPPLYRMLFRVRHSRRGRAIVSAYRRAKFALAERVNDGVCAFDIVGAMGFGATLTHMLVLLDYCDRRGLVPAIRTSNRLYRREGRRVNDWFGDFFVNLSGSKRSQTFLLYAKVQCNEDYPRVFADSIDIPRAHAIFTKYVAVTGEADGIADAFARANFRGRTLGVHYRGTDKVSEAPRVPWSLVESAVREAIAADPEIATVFVASDEPEFLRWLADRNLGVDLCSYDSQGAVTGGGAHDLSDGDGQRKGLEALVTILLLSKCEMVVRTPSHLSAWAKILNPEQEVVMLAKPYAAVMNFPERPIWESRSRPQAE